MNQRQPATKTRRNNAWQERRLQDAISKSKSTPENRYLQATASSNAKSVTSPDQRTPNQSTPGHATTSKRNLKTPTSALHRVSIKQEGTSTPTTQHDPDAFTPVKPRHLNKSDRKLLKQARDGILSPDQIKKLVGAGKLPPNWHTDPTRSKDSRDQTANISHPPPEDNAGQDFHPARKT